MGLKTPMIERYTVYWVDLEPTVGSEMAKRRPAVVISDDAMNARLQTVVVCPLTGRIHERWPSRVQTSTTGRPAEIAVDQIRTVSRRRIGDALGTLSSAEAASVRHVITEMYGALAVDSARE
jgi:mRNA interferase MazF